MFGSKNCCPDLYDNGCCKQQPARQRALHTARAFWCLPELQANQRFSVIWVTEVTKPLFITLLECNQRSAFYWDALECPACLHTPVTTPILLAASLLTSANFPGWHWLSWLTASWHFNKVTKLKTGRAPWHGATVPTRLLHSYYPVRHMVSHWHYLLHTRLLSGRLYCT